MKKRVSIMIDGDLVKKVRNEQARFLKNSVGAVSFSQTLNHYLREGLKNGKNSRLSTL